jgi:hypothetical protein
MLSLKIFYRQKITCLHRLLKFRKGDYTISVSIDFGHDGIKLLIAQILTEFCENLVKLGLGSGTYLFVVKQDEKIEHK